MAGEVHLNFLMVIRQSSLEDGDKDKGRLFLLVFYSTGRGRAAVTDTSMAWREIENLIFNT